MKRRRRRHRPNYDPPGAMRHAVAELLTEFFGVFIDASEIKPVTGMWKRIDVYRWEVQVRESGYPSKRHYGCWETMTEFVKDAKRNGIATVKHRSKAR